MAQAAHLLQEHAAFEVDVAIAAGKEEFDRKHMQTDSETEEENPETSDDIHDEPFPDYDVSTPEACERLLAEPTTSKKTPQSYPNNPLEASVQLARFRPICSSVDDLRALLTTRADLNLITDPGQLSPLRSVICGRGPATSAICGKFCSATEPLKVRKISGAGSSASILT